MTTITSTPYFIRVTRGNTYLVIPKEASCVIENSLPNEKTLYLGNDNLIVINFVEGVTINGTLTSYEAFDFNFSGLFGKTNQDAVLEQLLSISDSEKRINKRGFYINFTILPIQNVNYGLLGIRNQTQKPIYIRDYSSTTNSNTSIDMFLITNPTGTFDWVGTGIQTHTGITTIAEGTINHILICQQRTNNIGYIDLIINPNDYVILGARTLTGNNASVSLTLNYEYDNQ
jgi:hypothetical protein